MVMGLYEQPAHVAEHVVINKFRPLLLLLGKSETILDGMVMAV